MLCDYNAVGTQKINVNGTKNLDKLMHVDLTIYTESACPVKSPLAVSGGTIFMLM